MEVKVCVWGGLNLNFELCRFFVGIFGEEKSGVRLLFWTFDFTPSPACWINQAQPIFNWITFLFSLRKDPLHCQLDWCVRFLKICQDLSRSWIQMLDLAPSKPPPQLVRMSSTFSFKHICPCFGFCKDFFWGKYVNVGEIHLTLPSSFFPLQIENKRDFKLQQGEDLGGLCFH